MTIDMVLILLGLALIPAFIASSKGRSFALWYIYGVCLLIVAIPHSIIISKTTEQKDRELKSAGYVKCPYCKEPVKAGAVVCPHCRRELPPPDPHAVEDLVKCRTCGMTVKKDAKYCPRCGNLID
ncbi:zinc ribbon domain-containing protein [Megasphaera sp.]|jgi:predicted amidophosphoribosyltransferase|uniref:zinc ribbon domain-containing protein n=1 Tax=Megasphaera sp. TaxID=2023260 RepID=UPI004025490F